MGLELEELRVFLAVADTGSILRASELLGTSRARVRRLLDALEASLGTPLIVRQRDGVELTTHAREFLPEARLLIGNARALLTSFRERQESPTDVVRIGVQVGYPHAFALLLQQAVAGRFPEQQVAYHVAEQPAELLPDKVDLVLTLGEQRPRVPCVQVELGHLRQVLLASTAVADALGDPCALEDVIERLIGTWRGPDDASDDLHLSDGSVLAVRAPVSTSDESYLLHLARQGLGVVYAPLPPAPDQGSVVPLLPDLVGRPVPVRLLVPELLADTPRIAFLVETVRQAMSMFQRPG